MRIVGFVFSVILLGIFSIADSISIAAPQVPAPGGAPATQPATSPAARGGRRGGGRGAPITADEQAEVAKFAASPAWKPGDGDGNYSIGPDYTPCPEQTPKEGVPVGKVESFTMNAADSKFYPPTGLRGATPTRKVTVYIPTQLVAGKPAPFIISADAYGANRRQLPNILDNMIAAKRLPAMIAIMVANGGGDGGGSERGLEYDTVSGKFAEFAEAEILPRVEKEYGVTLSKDPDARMTLGGSSGGAVAWTMAWFHPELYHRTLIYSGTFVNQQSPQNPELPHGAWEYHEHLIANSPTKPIRAWLEVGERDNGATMAAAGLHNWVLANARMADVLKAKGYHYQMIYAKNAGHTDGKVIAQTYPQALEYVWQGYQAK
ncbi:MAG TPA: alpha/beta hydrolase-fold protein [Humisphaera sp.]|jgi:enterochelin esterase-like enzyme|nr:alpha/beta hydrolase-fold protein [Humisphaera sp.]